MHDGDSATTNRLSQIGGKLPKIAVNDAVTYVLVVTGVVAVFLGYLAIVRELQTRRRKRISELLLPQGFLTHSPSNKLLTLSTPPADAQQRAAYELLSSLPNDWKAELFKMLAIWPQRGFVDPRCVRFIASREMDGERVNFIELEIWVLRSGGKGGASHRHKVSIVAIDDTRYVVRRQWLRPLEAMEFVQSAKDKSAVV